ncbi:MAG: adenylate/guanylate cyclase domain-containing protein [Bacteroidia bacterium]
MLIIFISFIMCWLGVIWGLIYYQIFGWGSIVIIAFTYTLILLTAIFIGHIRKNHYILVHSLFILTVALPATIQFIIGSLDNSGMVISWCFMGALGSLIFLTVRHAIVWMLIFLGIVIYTVNFDPAILGYKLIVSDPVMKLQYNMNIIASYTVIFVTAAWFVKTFQTEKQRSEDLLLNILPKDVADELKKNGRVEPVSHEHSTVLFTDFKGFTEISEAITPKELVEEINHCFGAFDEITTRYNIEKIKTIGDSYMAVGGNFSENECTPWHVVSAGIELQKYIKKRKKERLSEGKFGFEMRVGVHSGAIISGVVGVKKFQFDIWGDTVNIASRMESHGDINEVNISGITKELIEDKFDFVYRGTLPVKGKSDMEMYFVKEKNDQPTV